MNATVADIRAKNMALCISKFFEVFNRKGLRVCVLRNYESLPESVTNDIDCIVSSNSFSSIRATMCTLAEETRSELVVTRRQYVWRFVLIRGCRPALIIDAIHEIGWWGAEYLTHEEIWSGARKFKDWWLPRPAHEAAISLLGSLLWGGVYKRKYADSLPVLIGQDEEEFRYVIRSRFGDQVLGLVDWVKQKEGERIKASVPHLRRRLWANALERDPVETLSRFIRFVWREAKVTLEKRGQFVALVGPDGVRNTSVSKELARQGGSLFRDVRYFHFRPPVVHGLDASLADAMDTRTPRIGLRPTLLDRLSSVPRIVRNLLLSHMGYWLRVFPALLRQRLVIGERYFHNYLIYPESVRYFEPAWFAACCTRLIPRPDLLMLLQDTSQRIVDRNAEMSKGEVERQLGAWLELVKKGEVDAIISVDAEPEETAQRVTDLVVNELICKRCTED